MKNRICAVVAVTFLCFLSSCGGGGNSSSAINVAGNWQFSATSTVFGFNSTATGQLNQSGSSVSGTMSLSGTPCAQSASFTGNVSGTNFSATLDENGQNVSFNGTLAANGSSVSGTSTAPAGGCTNGDAGTFTGERVSMMNGVFIGAFGPSNSIPANVVTRLHDDGGSVTGSATITNSLCFHSLNITGSVEGFNVKLHGSSGDESQTITFHGTFDQPSKSLTLEYAVSGGSCSGESGTAQLKYLGQQ